MSNPRSLKKKNPGSFHVIVLSSELGERMFGKGPGLPVIFGGVYFTGFSNTVEGWRGSGC